METQIHVNDPLRVGCGVEDFALVVFQRLDPIGDVACMMGNVGRDAEFVCHEGRCLSARSSSIA